jgi:hypothetical protein
VLNLRIEGMFVRFEVFTAVTMNNVVFWDVALCRFCVNRRFRGMYVEKSANGEPAWAGGCRLSHQSEIISYIRTGRERVSRPHGKSAERRWVGSLVKVKPAGGRGRPISGRGSVEGGEKSRATDCEWALTQK